ncbi:MAG: 2,3,4,5-tetrahydropyridine-2,6-dicarboxylate N-acetyltransferase, partial [Caldisericia bacterium]|nr:2,3,4,5-tetrahydropyridine-2,6-dicarboxylate N-acetyltransferase [Caldisericia bacterium]
GLDFVLILGEWERIKPWQEKNKSTISSSRIEADRRYSAVPPLNILDCEARIEPGAVIREQVTIGHNAVILMGAIINIGAEIGEETMIDMNAVIGGRAVIGKRCHIGAGAVIAGVIEPACAEPVRIEDDVFIGANAVVLEGIHIAQGAVVASGAVVTKDISPNTVVAGVPAKIIKKVDSGTIDKTSILSILRKIR